MSVSFISQPRLFNQYEISFFQVMITSCIMHDGAVSGSLRLRLRLRNLNGMKYSKFRRRKEPLTAP